MRRPCLQPGCRELAQYKGRCERHARAHERSIEREGYHLYRSKRWRVLRERVLNEEPICRICDEAISTEVDHIESIEQGGMKWDRHNLQALCSECHSKKTRAEQVSHEH